MSRFIALAASAMLLSLTTVAPAMADDALVAAPLQSEPVLVLSQQASAAPIVAQPAVYAPLTSLGATGLGGGALVFGGLAAVSLIGIVALAATDDDDPLEAAQSTR